jgi:hypothetical protein
VRENLSGADDDTLLPLRAAMGYEITRTLPFDRNTLLVDDPSDILLLNALSRALKRRGRQGLDSRWTMSPAGGIGSLKAFASLFGPDRQNIAVFSSLAVADRDRIEHLKASNMFGKGRVLTADRFTGKPEAGTEDLFETSVYCAVLNGAYGLEGDNLLNENKLEYARVDTARLASKAEAYFGNLPEGAIQYDRSRAPEWLLENPDFFDSEDLDLTKTLDNAAALFSAINGFLFLMCSSQMPMMRRSYRAILFSMIRS